MALYNTFELPHEAKSSLYKTELCRKFQENGFCRYGEKCQFAHGFDQLRNMPRHPKYKTERCKTFWTTGGCPYGTRCRFVHNEPGEPLSEGATGSNVMDSALFDNNMYGEHASSPLTHQKSGSNLRQSAGYNRSSSVGVYPTNPSVYPNDVMSFPHESMRNQGHYSAGGYDPSYNPSYEQQSYELQEHGIPNGASYGNHNLSYGSHSNQTLSHEHGVPAGASYGNHNGSHGSYNGSHSASTMNSDMYSMNHSQSIFGEEHLGQINRDGRMPAPNNIRKMPLSESKRIKCPRWYERGYCAYGIDCRYFHGPRNERVNSARHYNRESQIPGRPMVNSRLHSLRPSSVGVSRGHQTDFFPSPLLPMGSRSITASPLVMPSDDDDILRAIGNLTISNTPTADELDEANAGAQTGLATDEKESVPSMTKSVRDINTPETEVRKSYNDSDKNYSLTSSHLYDMGASVSSSLLAHDNGNPALEINGELGSSLDPNAKMFSVSPLFTGESADNDSYNLDLPS